MTRTIFTAAALAMFSALPVHAEQYAVRVNAAYEGATPGLLKSLKVAEIDNFTIEGDHYLILDAPGEAYVEAYVFAIGRRAVEVSALDADWTHPSVAEMPIEKRLRFLRQVDCDYCTS